MTASRMVLDSSVLVALLHGKDKHHTAARSWFAEVSSGVELSIPSIALCEVASVLSRNGIESDKVDRALEMLKSWVYVSSTSDELVEEALRAARDFKSRGCDSIFIALARLQRGTLVSFDKDQIKKGRALVRVHEIGE